MSRDPVISVVIPVHNAEERLEETLESLVWQTFKDFEVILIFNGCNDRSEELAVRFQSKKTLNIVLITLSETGIVPALNAGISRSRGSYIARLDADDICLPNRFAEQLKIFQECSEIAVCGSNVEYFGSFLPKKNQNSLLNIPLQDGAIHCELLFSNPFAHPSVMINRNQVTKELLVYEKDYVLAEDYLLWSKLSKRGFLFKNISTPLIRYRLHENQSTKQSKEIRIHSCNKIRNELLAHYLKSYHEDEISLHRNWALEEPFPCVQDLYQSFHLFRKMLVSANVVQSEKFGEWSSHLYTRWKRLLTLHEFLGVRVKMLFVVSSIFYRVHNFKAHASF